MNAIPLVRSRCARSVVLSMLLFGVGLPQAAVAEYTSNDSGAYRAVMLSIRMTYWRFCGSKNELSQANAATFMEEHSRALVCLCAPDARLATCTPAAATAAQPCFQLRARRGASTNALVCTVTLRYNQRGLLEAIVCDQPITLPTGRVVSAATPIPIETVMHACARLRQTRAPAMADLTLAAASFGGSYASPDYLKSKTRASIRGSVPVPYTSFEEISSFGITPMALFESDYAVTTFTRMDAGIEKGKKPNYVEYFGYPTSARGAGKSELYAAFVATLKDGQLNFVYKLFLDNRLGDVFTEEEYTSNRDKMRLAKAQRDLRYGRYIFAVNGEEHELANVPMLMRASRGGASAKKVKAPAAAR